ncbi:MAG: ABC-2 family transporter protein [Candidatus Diapherotrites archaeon]|nr:ABC-2 family transporter protein [Candidatus Diapherotrites archaeon]MDZ4256637.1 ABC-2 family transporter protein [archaeon]
MSRMAGKEKYWESFLLQLTSLLHYRWDFIVKWTILPFMAVIYYVLWQAVFASNPAFGGYTFEFIYSYLFLALLFRRAGSFFEEAWGVEQAIQKGDILVQIVRPINYLFYRLSLRTAYFVTLGLFFTPFVFLIPYLFLGHLPTLLNGVMVLILVTLGYIALFFLYHCIGMFSFWLGEISGVYTGIYFLSWLLSGAVIPISLLPSSVESLAFALPFYHQSAAPALLYLNQLQPGDFAQSFSILSLWIIGLYFARQYLWHHGLRHHDGKG